eukprot:613426-Prymnesium_polylepis.1
MVAFASASSARISAIGRALALHAIGRAHADTAAEHTGASSGWASAASGSAQALQRQQLLLLRLLQQQHDEQQQPRRRS